MNSNADKGNSSEISLHVVPITGESQSQLLRPFGPAVKNSLQICMSDFCRKGEARIHSGITSSAICTFEETVICLRHLNQIWFTCNHARAFERNHIFMRWQISDIMWAFRDNIK